MNILGQVLVAWLYSHFFEYFAHKYVLHNHKNFKSVFKQHFGTHHRVSRKSDMYDDSYLRAFSSKFEIISLFLAAIIHIPLYFWFPYAYATLVGCIFSYYFLHKRSHLNVDWGKKWMPWHYAHHMGKNQHMNWGVRLPIIDILFGTHKKLQNKSKSSEHISSS